MNKIQKGLTVFFMSVVIIALMAWGYFYYFQKQLLVVEQPVGGEVMKLGSNEIIRWTGGDKDIPVSIQLVSDSANYRCKKAGGKICPQDISLLVFIADNVPNSGIYNWTIGSSIETRKYWLQVCQNNTCGESKELISLTI